MLPHLAPLHRDHSILSPLSDFQAPFSLLLLGGDPGETTVSTFSAVKILSSCPTVTTSTSVAGLSDTLPITLFSFSCCSVGSGNISGRSSLPSSENVTEMLISVLNCSPTSTEGKEQTDAEREDVCGLDSMAVTSSNTSLWSALARSVPSPCSLLSA